MEPLLLDFQELGRALSPIIIHDFEVIDSTQNAGAQLLSAGEKAPFVVTSRKQMQGRGRLGRTWVSDDLGSLYSSFCFRPQCEAARLERLSLWVALEVAQALGDHFQLPIQVKWPNDLYLGGRKVAGMLAETTLLRGSVATLIFGMGLNINTDLGNCPEELRSKVGSLSSYAGNPLPMTAICAVACKAALSACEAVIEGADLSALVNRWKQRDWLLGKTVCARYPDHSIRGVVYGIDEHGRLLVQVESGQMEAVQGAQILVR